MKNKRIKVLTINISDNDGGASRSAYRIYCSTKTTGIETLFLTKNKKLSDETVLTVESFDKHKSIKAPFRWLQHKIKNKQQQAKWRLYEKKDGFFMSDLRGSSLHGALQKIDYDILHLHWVNLRFLDIRDLKKIKKPIVWTFHDCWAFTGICHYYYDCDAYKKTCGSCPQLNSDNKHDLSYKVWKTKMEIFSKLNLHIVCPSNWLANSARESTMFKNIPVSVIPYPINSNYFAPGNKIESCVALNLNPTKNYILYGAMNSTKDPRKGFAEFKKAMQYFEKNYNTENLEILVFGSNEKAQFGLTKIEQKDLGMLNDQQLLAAYRLSDVMVVPSLNENLSNIIMESLACGTPVVAFNIGGNADMIEHLKNGYLAQSLDIKDLAKGINFCLLNNADNGLSKAAREKVVRNFGTINVSDKYFKVYSEIVKLIDTNS